MSDASPSSKEPTTLNEAGRLDQTKSQQDNVDSVDSNNVSRSQVFKQLNQDCVEAICGFLTLKSDLLNLALSSTKILDIVLPYIYHDVVINRKILNRRQGNTLMRMLNHKNRGLESIRNVIFRTDFGERFKFPGHDAAAEAAKHLIMAVPRDCLFSFKYEMRDALPASTSLLLWQRQTRLRNCGFSTRASDIRMALGTQTISQACPSTDLTSLVVDDHASLDAYYPGQLLTNPKIDTLEVAMYRPPPDSDSDSVESPMFEYDASGALTMDHLTEKLFHAWLDESLEPLPPHTLKLKNLELWDVDLEQSKHTWLKAMDRSCLRNLTLVECKRIDRFLSALAANDLQDVPKLHHLFVSNAHEEINHRTVDLLVQLNSLLMACENCLETLKVVIEGGMSLPSVHAIAKHSKTLQHLLIDVHNGQDVQIHYEESVKEVTQMLSGMTSLRQLGISFPIIPGNESLNSDPYVLCDTSSDHFARMSDYMNAIFDHVDLTTLQVLNHPHQSHDFTSQSLGARAVSRSIAGTIFRESAKRAKKCGRSSQLQVVAFGSHHSNEDSNAVHTYMQHEVRVFRTTRLEVHDVPFTEFNHAPELLSILQPVGLAHGNMYNPILEHEDDSDAEDKEVSAADGS